MARAAAQAVNCLEPRANSLRQATDRLATDACGKCRACDRIARGVHVDVIAIEPDDRASIKIDVIRDVLSQTGFRPFEGRKRVVLIREADTLEPASQNALLKSLEEPPPGTMFILTSAVPGALLPTVRSRCMRLRFGRLTTAEIAAALIRDHDYSDVDAKQTAPIADGSIGQALALVDNDLSMFRELAMGLLQQAAGRSDTQSRVQAASALHTGRLEEGAHARGRGDRAAADGVDAARSRGDQRRRRSRGAGQPAADGDLEALARAYAGDRARAAFGAVDRALTALERNAGTKVVTEWLAVQM